MKLLQLHTLWRPFGGDATTARRAMVRTLFRVWNAPKIRLYRSSSGPPAESDTPFAHVDALPATPADTFADGTWYLSASRFNGCIDSGFLALGPNGETYRSLVLSGGAAADDRPVGPAAWRLEYRGSGVVRVVASYFPADRTPAEEWAIGVTTNGSTPAADTPTYTQAMFGPGNQLLGYDLPTAAGGTTVKVRLQTRRAVGLSWVYSSPSTVETLVVPAGPSAPLAIDRWTGVAITEAAE